MYVSHDDNIMVEIAEEGEFNGEELVLSDDDDDDDDNDEDDNGGIIDSNNQMQVHNTYMIIRNIF
jgi:hypothetical protein